MCQERKRCIFRGRECRLPHSRGCRQGRRHNQLRSPGDFEALLHWEAKREEAENSKVWRFVIVRSQLMEERSDSKEEENVGAYYLRKSTPYPLWLRIFG